MTETPYLSIVTTARNDNHGGNMLRRMQIFINGVIEQCRRHQLPAELIIVEWNPPVDKPRLTQALSWPVENSPCTVRIIEVPPDVHQQLKYSGSLPLFQMIAKNVGIRRARGQFVLATNIDLLFNDDLFKFLASRQLRAGKLYRLDRYDVSSDVPLEAPLEEQLAYCEQNILRINHRDGIEELKSKQEAEAPKEKESESSESLVSENLQALAQVPNSPQLLLQLKETYRQLLPIAVRDAILRQLPLGLRDWFISRGLLNVKPITPEPLTVISESDPPPPPTLSDEDWLALVGYPRLHTNACGDFTLMAKDDWFAVKGYPELEIFSFHLDSVLLHTAYQAGVQEKILETPMRFYHIEHASGWSPDVERDQSLNKRLATLGIPQMTNEQFSALAQLMQQVGKPILFNDENWGLINDTLPETTICPEASDRDLVGTILPDS